MKCPSKHTNLYWSTTHTHICWFLTFPSAPNSTPSSPITISLAPPEGCRWRPPSSFASLTRTRLFFLKNRSFLIQSFPAASLNSFSLAIFQRPVLAHLFTYTLSISQIWVLHRSELISWPSFCNRSCLWVHLGAISNKVRPWEAGRSIVRFRSSRQASSNSAAAWNAILLWEICRSKALLKQKTDGQRGKCVGGAWPTHGPNQIYHN